MVLCILYTIPKIPQGYYRFLLCILYKEALYILYPNSTRVLCLMYPIKWPYVFCTPKFHKGTIIILCILIRGFRCILYPKFQRVLRYLMYPIKRLYVFCTCLYPKFHKGTYLASKIPTSWCLLHICMYQTPPFTMKSLCVLIWEATWGSCLSMNPRCR